MYSSIEVLPLKLHHRDQLLISLIPLQLSALLPAVAQMETVHIRPLLVEAHLCVSVSLHVYSACIVAKLKCSTYGTIVFVEIWLIWGVELGIVTPPGPVTSEWRNVPKSLKLPRSTCMYMFERPRALYITLL